MTKTMQYKKIKDQLYFKTKDSKRFRPVYSRNKDGPSTSFKKLFRGSCDFNVHPEFAFSYNPTTNRFWKKGGAYAKRIKGKYKEINNRLINKSIELRDWGKKVDKFVKGRFKDTKKVRDRRKKSLCIKATSSLLHNVKQEFTFRDYYHFENWYNKMMDCEIMSKSPHHEKYKDVIGKYGYDVMQHSVMNVSWCKAGCYRDDAEKTITGAFYNFEVMNPKSRRNNCGIECLRRIPSVLMPSELKVRQAFNLKAGEQISPEVLGKMYVKYNTDAKVLSIINKDECIELTDNFNYILINKHHYSLVTKFMPKNVNRSKYKRALLAFDFETRKVSENSYTMVGDTKSFYIQDAICQVVYKDLKERRKSCVTFTSSKEKGTSARQFLDWLQAMHAEGKHFTCIAHNGARFDFYLLTEQFTKNEMQHTSINIRGTSVIQMQFAGHIFKDPCCFMPNTLSNLCDAFKVQTPKLKEFVYEGKTLTSMELCFYKPELDFYQFMELEHTEPEFWKLYLEYCYVDCVSLLELWQLFSDNMEDLVEKVGKFLKGTCTVNTSCTIGGLAKRMLTNLHKQDKFGRRRKYESFLFKEGLNAGSKGAIDDKIDPDKYAFVNLFKIGGISHCHQPGKHLESVSSIDITSQYPTAMKYMIIPVGVSRWTQKYERSKYGFYEISNLKFTKKNTLRPICTTDDQGRRQWANTKYDKVYADSEMIKYLKKHYGLDSFDVNLGLVSDDYMMGHSLFGKYVDTMFMAKA